MRNFLQGTEHAKCAQDVVRIPAHDKTCAALVFSSWAQHRRTVLAFLCQACAHLLQTTHDGQSARRTQAAAPDFHRWGLLRPLHDSGLSRPRTVRGPAGSAFCRRAPKPTSDWRRPPQPSYDERGHQTGARLRATSGHLRSSAFTASIDLPPRGFHSSHGNGGLIPRSAGTFPHTSDVCRVLDTGSPSPHSQRDVPAPRCGPLL